MQNQTATYPSSYREAQHKAIVQNHIGEIFRDYGEHYIRNYSPDLRKIKLIKAIRLCKSPALGGKVIVCQICDHHHYVYHSCGHSHCPICQSIKREQWIDKLKNELLNVPYVHMIFTLPHELNSVARLNKSIIYSLIMKCAWATVKTLASDSDNIGGLPGMINVLHTFGSDLKYHIHTHCLVTFGGINQNHQWVHPKRKDKIARYRQINSTYKKLFITELKGLYKKGSIKYAFDFEELVEVLEKKTWVVHNTKPTIDTSVLENYLARYINRIAVSKSRVEYLKATKEVRILYNDYANQKEGEAAPKKHKLTNPLSFIHQFMQHVLPAYFQKTRRYGLHASATKRKYEGLLPEAIKRNGHIVRTVMQIIKQLTKENPYVCEICQSEEYEILVIKAKKDWVHQYINVPNPRSPPNKISI